MAMQQDDPVQLIAQEQVRLFSEFKKWAEPTWQHASHCPGWTNARVVAHLTANAEFYQQTIGKATHGDCLPPSIPGGQRLSVEQFNERQAAKQEQLADLPRAELLDLFDRNSTALADLLRRLPPHNMTKPAWSPYGSWTIAMYVSVRVIELAFHGWDIHIALDPAAKIREHLQPFLLHFFLQTGKRSFQGGEDMDGVYRFEIQAGLAWCTRVFSGKMDHGPIEPAPDATIKTDLNHFLLLCGARVSLGALERRGLMVIEGDHERAAALLAAMSRQF